MAKPPDRRFDDSPFSGLPRRRVNRRATSGDAAQPRDDVPWWTDHAAERRERRERARRDDRTDDRVDGAAADRFGSRAPRHPDSVDRRDPARSRRRGADASRPVERDRDPANWRQGVPGSREPESREPGNREPGSARRESVGRFHGDEPWRSRTGQILRDVGRDAGPRERGRSGSFLGPDSREDRRRSTTRGEGARPRLDRAGQPDHWTGRPGGTSRGPVFRPESGPDQPTRPVGWSDTDDRTRAIDGGAGRVTDNAAPVLARSSGPGGRTLAIAAIIFVVVSVIAASASGLFSSSDPEPTATQVARGAPGDIPLGNATAVSSGPLVSFGSGAVPTSTLPPAGEQQAGFAGPYIDGVKTVCIDPGHGGPDRGRTFAGDATTPALEEATYTLQQGFALRDMLTQRGYVVVMTRTADQAVNADNADVNGDGKIGKPTDHDWVYDDIQARINICNRANADLIISIHINGYDTATPSGYETWYTQDRPFGDQSAVFAQLGVREIGNEMSSVGYTPEDRGAKSDGAVDVDSSNPDLAAHMLLTGPAIPGKLVPSNMPGAIMESLFITNPQDQKFLLNQDSTTLLATAYANAIDGYFSRYQY